MANFHPRKRSGKLMTRFFKCIFRPVLTAILVAPLLGLASGAYAEAVLTFTITDKDGAPPQTATMYLGDRNLKMETGQVGALYEVEAEKTLYYDHGSRTYFEMRTEEISAMRQQIVEAMRQQMHNLPAEQRLEMEAMLHQYAEEKASPALTYRQLSTGQKVGKWHCDVYEQLADGEKNAELCLARLGEVGLTQADLKIVAAFAHSVQKMASSMGAPGSEPHALDPAAIEKGVGFAAFPVRVAMLSRFVDPDEQEEVVAKLSTGEVDVVIGTHRLLSRDIAFRDLGLIIVDEEHRFGVAQKEQLRKMRVEVDVLTLTATPIPRTLEMSLGNIRDMSIIDTAPADRRPVRTFVGPFDERLLTAAIRRELSRSGQVFYVHNRVRSIGREHRRLQRLVPEARVAVAHGQMDEERLERTMLDFWEERVDVLLCTTIIEAGLDIPTTNTLIVDRADRLGLAQLYQLRGRVGRAGEQAYAYLFYPSNLRLTLTAHERLKTLASYTELGSGLAIAMKDLEIRGAGNLLGAEQHGHIEAVGFEMYVKLLDDAARELRGEQPEEIPEIRIDLPVDAYLPASYIDREPLRLAAYRRIAETVTHAEVDDVAAELQDRFGPLPRPAATLIEVAHLRADLRAHGIGDVSIAPHELYGRVAKIRGIHLDGEGRRRLAALPGRAVLSEATDTLLLSVPDDRGDLVAWLHESLDALMARDTVPAP
jgi:hypothetical protein